MCYRVLVGACDGSREDEVSAFAGLEPGGPILLLLKVNLQRRDCLDHAGGPHGGARWGRWRRGDAWWSWRGRDDAR